VSPRPAQGFTLMELLIVLAIIGIVAGLGLPGYLTYVAKLETAQVAGAYQQQLEAAQGLARRGQQVRLSTVADSTVAKTEILSGSTWTTRTSFALGNAKASAASSITLYPPYGTLDSAPTTLTFKSSRNSGITRTVRIISLMGKAVTP